jgi:hypothetical protein
VHGLLTSGSDYVQVNSNVNNELERKLRELLCHNLRYSDWLCLDDEESEFESR